VFQNITLVLETRTCDVKKSTITTKF